MELLHYNIKNNKKLKLYIKANDKKFEKILKVLLFIQK